MIYGIITVSVLLNVILTWYGRRLVTDLSDLSLEVEEVITDLNIYRLRESWRLYDPVQQVRGRRAYRCPRGANR